VVTAFDGGRMTSEAGAMLLGATDGRLRLTERFAGCFTDYRAAELVEHTVPNEARRFDQPAASPIAIMTPARQFPRLRRTRHHAALL
jgi:Transposase DDE domain group 1